MGAIVLLALGFRLWGIGNGLPYGQIPEETAEVSTSLRIAAGEPPRYWFRRVGWPTSQLPLHGLHFLYLRLTTPGFGLDDFEAAYFTNRGAFLLSARVLVAVIASLSVMGGYAAVRALTGSDAGGLLTALLLAIHPWHVYISHVALPDGYALAWVAVALLASIRIAQTGARWAYILAGVAVAVVILTRLQAMTVALSVALAHVVHWKRQNGRPRDLLLAGWPWALGAFVVATVVFNPFVVISPARAWDDIVSQAFQKLGRNKDLAARWKAIRANQRFPITIVRPYVAVAALVGAAIATIRRDWDALVVAVFGVGLVLTLAPLTRTKVTYSLPLLVPAALLAGYGLTVLAKSQVRWLRWAAALLYLVILGWSVAESVTIDRAMANTNTKMVTYEWIAENVPPGSNILVADPAIYGVPLARTEESLARAQALTTLTASEEFWLDHPEEAHQPQYNLYGPEVKPQITDDESWWAFVRDNQITYVVEADYCSRAGYSYDSASNIEFPVLTVPVRAELELLAEFSPFDTGPCQQYIPLRLHLQNMDLGGWERVGPLIRVYRVPHKP